MAGKPKEHIVDTLEQYIDVMKKNKGIIVISEEAGEPKFHEEEEIWHTFKELDLLVEGIEKFVYICVTFTPASIEIIEPKSLTFSEKDLTDWLNELLGLLHEIGMKHKIRTQEAKLHLKNLDALMQNMVLLVLEREALPINDIKTKTGVDLKTIEFYLQKLEKEGRIEKKGEKWIRN